jgi:hypothetical protein
MNGDKGPPEPRFEPETDAFGTTIFHEPWWLSAASKGRYNEVTVKQGNEVVGRLPFLLNKRMGFRLVRMPPLTHLLGPIVVAGDGKYQTQMGRRLSIVRALIDQLPHFHFFKQALDPSIASGLAIADGLAFQERGFTVKPQYNFQIDCRRDLSGVWDGMNFKTRQHIRQAEQRYLVAPLDDPQQFVDFYTSTLARRIRNAAQSNLHNFPLLYTECKARTCGEILVAKTPRGVPAAMTFLVWGYGYMYYLLSTRVANIEDNGSTNLLIWEAIKRAHKLRLTFDFDGIATSGIARFYAGYGGKIKTRLIVTGVKSIYRGMQYLSRLNKPDESHKFT